MNLDQRIKLQLGELIFTINQLQIELEALKKEKNDTTPEE